MLVTHDTYAQVLKDIMSLGPEEHIAIDTETTGLKPWLDTELRGVCLAWRNRSVYVPLTHPHSENMEKGPLHVALRQCAALPIYHHSDYDFAILDRGLGLTPQPLYRDTMILAWLQDENRRKGLKYLGSILLGADEAAEQTALKALMKGETQAESYRRRRQWLKDTGDPRRESAADSKDWAVAESEASKRTWADLTAAEIAPYGAQDASLTLRLYHHLLQEPEYKNVQPAVQRHHDFQHTVYRMERIGVAVDEGHCVTARERNQKRMADIESQFEVNINSAPQLAELLYSTWGLPVPERTDGGQPSTSRTALEALAGAHGGLDLILEHRRLAKANSAYYSTLLENLDHQSRVHAKFNVCGTVTGRLACSDPNLMTIPRDETMPEVKAAFVPTPGYELVSFDLKQAELRFAASISDDQALQQAIASGDVYQATADALGVTRQVGKMLVLSYQYGVGPRTFARNLVKGTGRLVTAADVRRARTVLAGYAETYPQLAETMERLATYADIAGRLPMLQDGRFRHFVSKTMAYPVASYTALNAACQNGVADYVANVMVALEPELPALGARMVLQVHDSIVLEAVPGTLQRLALLIQQIGNDLNPVAMPQIWEPKRGL